MDEWEEFTVGVFVGVVAGAVGFDCMENPVSAACVTVAITMVGCRLVDHGEPEQGGVKCAGI